MGRVSEKFRVLKAQGRKAFAPFLIFGFPTIQRSIDILYTLVEAGADLIELGMPFSDPIADGRIIQQASSRALKQGVTLTGLLSVLKKEKKHLSSPLILMSYYNPIFAMPEGRFFSQARGLLDGVIVPDLPYAEAGKFIQSAHQNSMDTIFFATPTTEFSRIPDLDKASSGFVYYVAVVGTTGTQREFAQEIFDHIRLVRKHLTKPLCVGFGISNQKQADAFRHVSDGVIIGSAIVEKIIAWEKDKNFLKKLREFAIWLKGS